MTAWNPEKVRQDFVLLRNTDRVYFDNAATSQKPQCVLDAVEEFYQKYNANVLRGLYPLRWRRPNAMRLPENCTAVYTCCLS
ncbi:MAG: aminotransferase class V-fold PLP-dependent enzyme [Ruminococcus callidus]